MNKSTEKHEAQSPSFKKGITLEDYMKQANDLDGNDSHQDSSQEEDLYAAAIGKQERTYSKMVTFEINELDQENYRQESQQMGGGQSQDMKRCPIIDQSEREDIEDQADTHQTNLPIRDRVQYSGSQSIDNKALKAHYNDSKAFRIKNQSNSPRKLPPSPQKQMFRSLYGNSFGGSFARPSEPSILSSTIHNKFFKLSSTKQGSKKEVEFKQKNKKHYNQVMKYENVVRNKYYSKFDILNIRVDGVKDRLCERKPFQRV